MTKTVNATWNGHFFDTRVPLKSAYVIGCPQGRAATGAGFAAYDDHPHPRTRVPEARLAVMEPIVSQDGTVIGFRMQVERDRDHVQKSWWISAKWWVEFSVFCAKLGA